MNTPRISLDQRALGATVKGYAKMINQMAIESKRLCLKPNGMWHKNRRHT